jgi:sarcosine oxidase subunit gamma
MAKSDRRSTPEVSGARPERVSALAHRAAVSGADGLVMQEAEHLGKLVLRLDAETAGGTVVEGRLKISLPAVPCTSSTLPSGSLSALWLGPDEWMLVCDTGAETRLEQELEKALDGQHSQICNVTDYYVCIDITGHQTREILMNLTTLDMDKRSFMPGQVKGTILGHANAFVWQLHTDTGAAETFRLVVRSSMADYLWCLVTRSGRLFGLAEELPVAGERLVI